MHVRTLLAAVTLLFLLTPSVAGAQNSRGELERIARAMGATNLKSIEITGSGVEYAVGQSVVPGAPWPRFTVTDFTRAADYQAGALRETYVRAAPGPAAWRGVPSRGEARVQSFMSGDYAWNVANARRARYRSRSSSVGSSWDHTHGVIKRPSRTRRRQGPHDHLQHSRSMNVRATVDRKRLVEYFQARFPTRARRLTIETLYSDYRRRGVQFPMRWSVGGRVPVRRPGHHAVRPKAPLDLPVPEAVRKRRRRTPGSRPRR